MDIQYIKKEDYEEPAFPHCTKTGGGSVPMSRVTEKLDKYLERKDFAAAEKHLDYWTAEASAIGDKRGELNILNETLTLMRRTQQKNKAYKAAERAEELIEELQFGETVTAGTTYVNIATVLKSFDENLKATEYYKKAEKIYKSILNADDARLGGLYNNIALAYADSGRFSEADTYYKKAVEIMKNVKNGELETAITYLNMANLCELQHGTENGEAEISELLEDAMKLLDTPTIPHDGYYAFVCEKCAPTFGYYGYFLYENDLIKRAEKIYEVI